MFGRGSGERRRIAGERVLAAARTAEGVELHATRSALHVSPPDDGSSCRFGWDEIHAATWDAETSVFTLRETASGTAVPEVFRFVLADSGRFLTLVRERVEASVVVQRSVPVTGGVAQVVLRRAQGPAGDFSWSIAWPEGVRAVDHVSLDAVRAEVGRIREELGLDEPPPSLFAGQA